MEELRNDIHFKEDCIDRKERERERLDQAITNETADHNVALGKMNKHLDDQTKTIEDMARLFEGLKVLNETNQKDSQKASQCFTGQQKDKLGLDIQLQELKQQGVRLKTQHNERKTTIKELMLNDTKAMRNMEAFVMNEVAMDEKITTYGHDKKDEFGKRC
jgi:hypothetical protein